MPPSPEAAPASALSSRSPSRSTRERRRPKPSQMPTMTERRPGTRAGQSSAGQEDRCGQEEIKIGTEKQETGRLRSPAIRTREEVVDQTTITEKLEITRVPINRPVDGPVTVRTKGYDDCAGG